MSVLIASFGPDWCRARRSAPNIIKRVFNEPQSAPALRRKATYLASTPVDATEYKGVGGHDGELALAFYQEQLPELLRTHPGQYVVIRNDMIEGLYDDYQTALVEAMNRFATTGFFLSRIIATSDPDSFGW